MPGSIPEISHQIVHLVDLLKRVREGRLRVPNFQREFVWQRKDILDLYESVVRQYPIGTLFLWGKHPPPLSRPRIGPLRLPDYKGETWLLLDGQQRLTTLVGVLLSDDPNWSVEGDDDPVRWNVYYDAENQGFAHVTNERIPDYYFPVAAMFDTVKFFGRVERMLKQGERHPEKVRAWVASAQEAAGALQRYRIPIVEIRVEDMETAVESFSRLNKKGRGIATDEMISALTYKEGDGKPFHLAAEIDNLQAETVRADFGRVDRKVLLRTVLLCAHLDIYRTDWTAFGDVTRSEVDAKLPVALADASTSLRRARELLARWGVHNVRMLPYSMQLVTLAAFFSECRSPTPQQISFLRRWFWSSSFTGSFGGSSAHTRRLIKEFRDVLPKNAAPMQLRETDLDQAALSMPLRFDLSSARVRAMLCVLFLRNPLLPNGEPMGIADAARRVLGRGPLAMVAICPDIADAALRKSPANRILDVAEAPARQWLLNLDPLVRDRVLESHAISPDAMECLARGDDAGFLELRLSSLVEMERAFLEREGLPGPTDPRPAPSPLDADDDLPTGEGE